MAKGGKFKTTGRTTRREREEHGLPCYLPFANVTTPSFRRAISEKASDEQFQTLETLKWLSFSDEISKVLDTMNLYPIIKEEQYAIILEGNLANETLYLIIKKDELPDDVADNIARIDEAALTVPDEDDYLFRGKDIAVYNAENEKFPEVLRQLSVEMTFTPTVIFLDTDGEVDLYFRSCIRKIATSKLSLQYQTIKILVQDILATDPDHADANRLKNECIDAKMDYPYQDDVYYFISWGGEETGYRLRRDTEQSPRLGDKNF